MKIYLVGGACRDLLMGIPSKDNDYVCECDFPTLTTYVESLGFKVLHSKPEFLTIRASTGKQVVDFTCCREEADYDGRRPGFTKPASLATDLLRRDFTVNALAMEVDSSLNPIGNIIDLVNGKTDLEQRILRFVGNPAERLEEDGLRWLRAIRFSITKGFWIEPNTYNHLMSAEASIMDKVSVERIREELYKCFKYDTIKTLEFLHTLPKIWFRDGIWLQPTLKQ